MSYNADGRIATTVVNGSTYTGRYAADGSWNIVLNDGSSLTGLTHPCGALNAVINDSAVTYYASNGSVNVVTLSPGVYSPKYP
jgi:hypothetical protein